MQRKQPAFKATQLYDWESEPALEQSSTFFHDEEFASAPNRMARRKDRGAMLLLILGLVIGAGFIGLLRLAPLLQRLFG
jgi:hypothetical protein